MDRLQLVEASVEDLIVEDGAVHGVITAEGISLRARCVVLTTGTFLRGEILIGRTRRAAGRFARATAHGDEGALEVEGASVGVAATLDRLGLPLARLKTGTPPRLDGRTIAWSDLRLSAQPSETPPTFLSYRNALRDSPIAPSVITCFMTHTTDETLRIVRESSHTLPTYQGDEAGAHSALCSLQSPPSTHPHPHPPRLTLRQPLDTTPWTWPFRRWATVLPLNRHQSGTVSRGAAPSGSAHPE